MKKAPAGRHPGTIEVRLSRKAMVALDQVRGPRPRDEYLSEWIEARWRAYSPDIKLEAVGR